MVLGLITVWAVTPSVAEAGKGKCNINISVKNTGTSYVYAGGEPPSGVRTANSTWRSMLLGGWHGYRVKPGSTETGVYKPVLKKCGKPRRYRLNYYCKGGPRFGEKFTEYFPSKKGWTGIKNITFTMSKC